MGKRVKIELPEEVPDKSKNAELSICKKKFFNTEGLGVHKLICSQDHPQYATAEINQHVTPSRSREKAESVVEKVQSVVNYLLKTVAVGDQGKEVKDKMKATWGSNVCKKHTAVFKAKVILQVQPDISQDQIAQKYGTSQSLVSKWLKDKDSIIAAAANKNRKFYAKQRKSTKYLKLFRLLFDQLKAARDKGR